ncbi:hypothetical protein BT93_L2917 [Corymbia citriodora subsp. variegata]|uniref:S-protein homolog n=1 Tax=Corymbia citriodora subsp. variegata TaxID=360336 RepID=A0A8T0CIF3_CORYI|nr:hypothetical protein BT93_L2917 [Corymbia citriodora subsp. variegata]
MNSSIRLFVAFTIISTLLQSCSGSFPWVSKRVHVQIFNTLPDGVTLTVHCKSRDDDLGVQQIPPNGMWQFSFRTSVMGTTLFFCNFQDLYECGRWCVWYVQPTGPCLYQTDCRQWNS